MDIRLQIENDIRQCANGDFTEAAANLLKTLGYQTEFKVKLPDEPDKFLAALDEKHGVPPTKTAAAFIDSVQHIQMLFQFGTDELKAIQRDTKQVAPKYKSFYFFAVQLIDPQELNKQKYTRSDFATFTREINKHVNQPSIVLFRSQNANGDQFVTLAFVKRRENLKDNTRDVILQRVSVLREISCADPHTGHVQILHDLTLSQLKSADFDQLFADWLNVLDTELLNENFYGELVGWFELVMAEAKFPERGGSKQQHIIRLISRLLFIWFIKEKGLVNEKLFTEQFAKYMLKDYQLNNYNYYHAILQNLFFATLNTEIGNREFSKENNGTHRDFSFYRYRKMMTKPDEFLEMMKQTPFVNGGLFDCLDPFEAGDNRIDCFTDTGCHKQVRISNSLFFGTDGIFEIFNRYKFTVEESTPIEQEVALDPELLGQVFERFLKLFGEEEETGSYYTPRVIVDYMVREALLAYYSEQMPKVDKATIRNLLTEEVDYEQTENKLSPTEIKKFVNYTDKLRILDPAVGSGAFPMGVLARLTMTLRRIDPKNEILRKHEEDVANLFDDSVQREYAQKQIANRFSEKNQYNSYARKLLIIQKSIFGADLQSIAVQLCRLRFFISLIIEQEGSTDSTKNYGIEPLPNLDTKIIAADTLIKVEKKEQAVSFDEAEFKKQVDQRLKQILEVRRTFFEAKTRKDKIRIRKDDAKLRRKLADLLKSNNYSAVNADKIANWDLYDQTTSADWFEPEWMFGIADGFDIVIGNPPYIQLQKKRGRLADKYEPQEYETFARTGDIYCLFYERGLQLTKSAGHLCYISSNKWMLTGYGKATRKFFTQFNPIGLIDLGSGIFDATVGTNILLIQNATNQNELQAVTLQKQANYPTVTDITEQVLGNSLKLDITKLDSNSFWFIATPKEFELKSKIREEGIPLKYWNVSIYRGLTIGYNDAFIIDATRRQAILDACADTAERKRTADIIKPILRGGDIQRYHAKSTNQFLINLHNGYKTENERVPPLDIDDYPAIKRWLDTHWVAIEKRQDQGKTPYNLRNCAFLPEFEKEKIVWKRIGSILRFSLDKDHYCLDSTCIMTGESIKLILAVLNSKLGNYILQDSPRTGMGELIISVQALNPFPIPKITPENAHLARDIENCVDKILADPQGSEVSDLEKDINKHVYKLYGITDQAEIDLIEGNPPTE